MTIKANSFEVTGLRLVAFMPSPVEFNPSSLLSIVLGKYARQFNGDVQSLPLGPEAPPTIPRIHLASETNEWTFSSSLIHVTSAWQKQTEDSTLTIQDIVDRCRSPLEEHLYENKVPVGRLSYVISRAKESENPPQTLIDRFCRDEVKNDDLPEAPLRNSRNFELHNHKRYLLSKPDITVNSWFRCKTAIDSERSLITIEQDINTLAEDLDTRTFSQNERLLFFDNALTESNSILEKYFPNSK